MLISERGARTFRIVRNGILDPQPITGLPVMIKGSGSRAGVDIALHPQFTENRLVYFTYWKPRPGDEDVGTAVLARGRFDAGSVALTDVRDLFVSGRNGRRAGGCAHRVRSRRQGLHDYRVAWVHQACRDAVQWGGSGYACGQSATPQRRRQRPAR